MPDEDDPLVWALASILAHRQEQEPDSDHYACALDLITQMKGAGYEVRAVAG